MNTIVSNDKELRISTVHQFFRGSSEIVKLAQAIALTLEALTISIATYYAFNSQTPWSDKSPLLMLFLLAIAINLRFYAQNTYNYSQRCKRISAKSFAYNKDINPKEVSNIRENAPLFTKRFAEKLPANTLKDYYEPTKPHGAQLLREIYAHSSFYSWRLLNKLGILLLTIAVGIASIALITLYNLAVSPPAETTAIILESLCTFIFFGFFQKSFYFGLSALQSSRTAHEIADTLCEKINVETINNLAFDYDIMMSNAPSIPTFIYRYSRPSLQKSWHERRKSLDEFQPRHY